MNGLRQPCHSKAMACQGNKKGPSRGLFIKCWFASAQSDLPCSTSKEPWSTASRNALPGLKWGTRFSGICTLSPDRGLRPTRGGRRLMVKLPKPRISIRWPLTKASLMASSTVLTANSASRWVNCSKRAAKASTRSTRSTWPRSTPTAPLQAPTAPFR